MNRDVHILFRSNKMKGLILGGEENAKDSNL